MKVLIVLLVIGVFERVQSSSEGGSTEKEKGPARTSKGFYINSKMVDNRNLFSPRMDYDEWTPLGRGDPLKNDPTYDYVPPVLERVHYWMDPSKRTPDPPVLNSGVLILGSSRTEPTFSLRLTTPKYQVVKESQADSRLDTMSLLDPFLKLVDVSKLGINLSPSTNSNYHKSTTSSNRIHQQSYQRPIHNQQHTSHRYQPPQALQRPPYTMLMPPPPPPPSSSSTSSPVMTFATIITTTETPKSQNYQETMSAVIQTTVTAAGTTATSTLTPPVSTKTNPDSNITTIYPTTMLANTENVYKPVAIAMPEENETIRNDVNEKNGQMEKSETKKEDEAEGETAVLPMLSSSGKNKKNAEEGYASTYEKNNNFQAGKHPSTVLYHEYERPLPEMHSNSGNIYKPKEPYKYRPLYDNVDASGVHDNNLKLANQVKTQPPKGTKMGEKFQSAYKWGSDNRAATARPVTTTRVSSTLTTDPMFKHYKQPSEPIKGPFYLIIQGHSKVKTYGASKNPINGLLTSNEIKDAEDRKDRYGELHDLEAQETKRRRGKSLKWRAREANPLKEEEDTEYGKFFDGLADGNDITPPGIPELEQSRNLENFEDAFGKSKGGSSKKRYLMYDTLNDTYVRLERSVRGSRQLLSTGEVEAAATPWPATMITVTNRPTVSADSKDANKTNENGENLDIESFIALNDDYAPEDVVSLLLKEEGQGSGLGNFVASIFGKSLKDGEIK